MNISLEVNLVFCIGFFIVYFFVILFAKNKEMKGFGMREKMLAFVKCLIFYLIGICVIHFAISAGIYWAIPEREVEDWHNAIWLTNIFTPTFWMGVFGGVIVAKFNALHSENHLTQSNR